LAIIETPIIGVDSRTNNTALVATALLVDRATQIGA